MTFFVLLCMAGLVGLWSWGDRQAQELGEWRRVWGGVYLEVTGETMLPAGASVETLGRNALKSWEAAKRGGAEVRRGVDELEAALKASDARAAAAEKSLSALRADMEREEQEAVAALRETYLSGIETSRAEVAQAREERAEAVKALAAAQTRLAELQATLDAVMSAPGDAVALEGESGNAEDAEPAAPEIPATRKPGKNRKTSKNREPQETPETLETPSPTETPETPETPEPQEAETAPDASAAPALAAALAEAAPDLTPAEIAVLTGEVEVAEEPEGEPGKAEETVVASRVVGESRLFLTLTYQEADATLRVQFQNGAELVYAGVPRRVADALLDAGNKIDTRMRERVKGKYAADGNEDAVWKACTKWNRNRQGRMEALWVEE